MFTSKATPKYIGRFIYYCDVLLIIVYKVDVQYKNYQLFQTNYKLTYYL